MTNGRIPAVLATLTILALGSDPASTQRAPSKTLRFDEVHFAVSEPEKAVEWYRRTTGATPFKETGDPRVMFDGVRLIFKKVDNVKPSAGAALDHIGLSFANVDEAMKTLVAAGARVVQPARDVPGLYRTGTVEDPWGITLEIVQDPQHLGFHSVHLRAADPVATLRWYVEAFGGEPGNFKG